MACDAAVVEEFAGAAVAWALRGVACDAEGWKVGVTGDGTAVWSSRRSGVPKSWGDVDYMLVIERGRVE